MSILNDIKKLLGIDTNYYAFDTDVIININSAMSILEQLGMPTFSITGDSETWSDYLGDDNRLDLVKTYIYLKVKKVFDPSASSTILSAYNEEMKELEWRINSKVDYEKEES